MGKRTRTSEGQREEDRSSTSNEGHSKATVREGKRGGAKLRYKTTGSSKRSKPTLTLPAPLSLEGSLSEEVLLRCLSFLTAHDLVTVSRVSSAWYRLSQDPQLWRYLYLRTYASASSRRQALGGIAIARSRPWKDLYKISTNWRNGSAKSSTVLTNTVRKAVLAPLPTDISLPGEPEARPATPAPREERHETLLQVHQQYFISATRAPSILPSDPPTITISHTLPSGQTQHLASISSSCLSDFYSSRPDFRPPLSITELRLDESTSASHSNSIFLSVFYSTGQFSIFRLQFPTTTTPFQSEEVHTSLSLSSSVYTHSNTTPFDSVAFAKLHYPLLVTCSKSFTLRFYRLSITKAGGLEVRETETPLQSRERWAPVVLSLEKVRSRNKDRSFKVSLAYSLPVFPNNWTVGLQEFTITLSPSPSSPASISVLSALSPPTSTPLPTRRHSLPFSPSPPPSSPVTSIEYSSPYIVTSLANNTISVYLVSRTSQKLEINHEKTLFGHTARVGSVAIIRSEGRGKEHKVVSAGDDGAFKVWSLASSHVGGKRKREEEMTEIITTLGEEIEEEGTEFQRMKLRRAKGLPVRIESERHEAGGRPRKVRKILVDEDKIVVVGESGEGGEGEKVRVLRFD